MARANPELLAFKIRLGRKLLRAIPYAIAYFRSPPIHLVGLQNMQQKEYSIEWGGRTLTIQFPNWAEQSNGSVLVRYGDTVVLGTVVMAKKPRAGENFFPLMVDYQEKFYATGRIRGSRFVKREGRPRDAAVLTTRMSDRSLRPRFDQRMRNDVQVTLIVLSADGINKPDIPAFIAASLSVLTSDIPWDGPVAAARVGRIGGEWTLNPASDIPGNRDIDIVVAGTQEHVNMLEAGANQISEGEMLEAIEFGHASIQAILELQKKIRQEIGAEKTMVPLLEPDEELRREVHDFTSGKLEGALFREFKKERMDAVIELKETFCASLKEKYPDNAFRVETALELFEKEIDRLVHEKVLKDKQRVDGRGLEDLRDLSAQVGLLPRTHGSGLFMRGLTHILATCTLGAPGDAQIVEEIDGEYTKNFMHH